MAEYIEKQAALDAILRESPDAHYPSWYAERIKALPVDDVVPVVRCCDCRKRGLPECPMETEYPWIDADSDGFCNQGVKKKGDEHTNID